MFKKITSITILTTGEGKRISLTYSEIDEGGNLTSENNRVNRIIVNEDVLEKVAEIETFAKGIIEEN